MKIDQVALQLYTVRDKLKTVPDITATLKAVSDIGYRAVQVSGVGEIEVSELAKILSDNGLVCCSTHEPVNAILQETDTVIERLKALGCSTTAIPHLSADYRSAEGYLKLASEATEAGRKLKEAGITLMYHNHRFEFEKYDGRTGLEIIYEESDPECLQGEIDTYWVQAGGGSPAGWCRRLKNRLPVVHLKDMIIVNDAQVMCEIGSGNLDFKEICSVCEEGGTLWYAVEQDTCAGDSLESSRISFNYIKETLCT